MTQTPTWPIHTAHCDMVPEYAARAASLARAVRRTVERDLEVIPGVRVLSGNIDLRADMTYDFRLQLFGWTHALHAAQIETSFNLTRCAERAWMIGQGMTVEDAEKAVARTASNAFKRTRLLEDRDEVETPDQIAEAHADSLHHLVSLQGRLSRIAAREGIRRAITHDLIWTARGNGRWTRTNMVGEELGDESRPPHGCLRVARHSIDAMLLKPTTDNGRGPFSPAIVLDEIMTRIRSIDQCNVLEYDQKHPRGRQTDGMTNTPPWSDCATTTVRDDMVHAHLRLTLPGDVDLLDDRITLPAQNLPDTVVAAMQGRVLGRIVETGIPSLDALTVTRAHVDHEDEHRLVLGFESDEVRLDEHPALRPLLVHTPWWSRFVPKRWTI